ncbi:hypothetical protein Pfo_026607 [Paulownia fortunei]|nr:hypothetical protein Pfo_026607 [Paulownia fortunei]
MSYINKKNLLCFLILSACFLQTMARICFLTPKYIVHVVNNILPISTSPLLVHCASGDNDIGNHTLYYEGDFTWSFCEQVFLRTLFFCHLSWGSKSISFDVFNSKLRKDCSTSMCYWEAQTDGIYFCNHYPPQDLKKVYSW